MNLLVAIPVRYGTPQALFVQAMELYRALLDHQANRELFNVTLAVHFDDWHARKPAGASPFWPHAQARNELLDRHLRAPHDLVFWVDVDIMDYPADLPARLWQANPGGVTAPLVLHQNSRFYDVRAFVQPGGQCVYPKPPYFAHDGELVEMWSVGSCYIIPAAVYRVARYEGLPAGDGFDPRLATTGHIEHWPVMVAARELGYPVRCLTTATAYHADLPSYGEAWH